MTRTTIVSLADDPTVGLPDCRPLRLDARSALVHSDTPGAAAHARAIRSAVERAGGSIVPLAELLGEAGVVAPPGHCMGGVHDGSGGS